jgi:hypothetical protein
MVSALVIGEPPELARKPWNAIERGTLLEAAA